MARFIAVMVCAALVLLPSLAQACPACVAVQEENRMAYIITTGILTVLPLGMIGGFVWWLRKRARMMEAAPGLRQR